MPFKASLFFQMNAFGWTESYYSLGATLEDVRITAELLAQKRALMLPGTSRITYIRVSDVNVFRDSMLVPLPAVGFGGGQFGAQFAAEFPSTAILIRLFATAVARGRIFLRGAQSNTGLDGNRQELNPEQVPFLTAYLAQLANPVQNWAIRHLNPSLQPIPIETIVTNPIDLTVVTQAAHGAVLGDRVRISRVETVGGNPPPNGVYRVLAVTNPTTLLLTPTHPGGDFDIPMTGTLRVLRYIYSPITAAGFIRVVTKRTGRPFDSPRGRFPRAVP